MTNRKALLVGINKYVGIKPLKCCVNDVEAVSELLEFNDDGTRNFSIMKLTDSEATYDNIMDGIDEVFGKDDDIGLFYFSGHGCDDRNDGKIVSYDYDIHHNGIRFRDIIDRINESKCKNKIIILDCCFAGKMGNYTLIGDSTVLPCGTTIMTACNKEEYSVEVNGHGIFTQLLIDALSGGASDVFGRITPAAIYSYVDTSLGDFEQRPLFKSHVSSFVNIRNSVAKFKIVDMRKIMQLFDSNDAKFQIDPSYEPTNYKGSTAIAKDDLKEPYCTKEHTILFKLFQEANHLGLLVPSTEKHMYYAAMNSDTIKLTKLGMHYWYLVHNKII